MLNTKGESLLNKTVAISGSGNVAQYAIEKCIELGIQFNFVQLYSSQKDVLCRKPHQQVCMTLKKIWSEQIERSFGEIFIENNLVTIDF